MNREIKFRAWDESQKYMAYQGEPDLETIQSFMHHFGDKILMQFTGLYDINGKEIYEGDILRWVSSNPFSKGEIRKIQVNYVQAQFWCQGTIGVYLAELLANEKCDVIGNIFENPELLTT